MQDLNLKPIQPKFDKWRMATLAFEMGYIIALPLVGFAFLGRFLDTKWDTAPGMTLLGIAIAITATTIWLVKRLKEYIK